MGSPSKIKKICEPFAMGGNKVMTFNYFSGPVSYTTGGDAINANDLGLVWIHQVFISYAEDGTQLMIPVYETGGGPVKSFKALLASIAGVQVANASDQSAKKFRIVAIGTY